MSEHLAEATHPEPLSRDRILDAAFRLADAEGVAAVTMRRLGRELGVEAMSLYHHVPDKDAVLTGLLERAMSEFEIPDGEPRDWSDRLRDMSRHFRHLLLRHPWVIGLMSEKAGPMTDPRALRPVEVALDTLRRAGFSTEDTMHAYRAVVGFVAGSAMLEVAGFMSPDEPDWADVEATLQAIPTAEFPRLAELLPALHDCDVAEEFEQGLDLLLAGLRTRLG